MQKQSIIVIDDFYDDPFAVRKMALSLEYNRKPGASYPGKEAYIPDPNWQKARDQLRSYINEPCDGPSPKNPAFLQGKFRIALAEDDKTRLDGVHQDVQRWSGIVYLSLPKDCKGGVALFRHKETGVTAATPEWEHKVFSKLLSLEPKERSIALLAYGRDYSNWEEIGLIPMKFNRAILLMAQCFHSSAGIFGDNFENGRLTQHFEFYSG